MRRNILLQLKSNFAFKYPVCYGDIDLDLLTIEKAEYT